MDDKTQQILEYLRDFIEGLEGSGLIITDESDLEDELQRIAETGFPVLSAIFNPTEENKEFQYYK